MDKDNCGKIHCGNTDCNAVLCYYPLDNPPTCYLETYCALCIDLVDSTQAPPSNVIPLKVVNCG